MLKSIQNLWSILKAGKILKSKQYKESYLYFSDLNLNFNSEDLEEVKLRCLSLSTSIEIDDYIYVNEFGISYADLDIILQAADVQNILNLIIPEGIDVLILRKGYYNYSGSIIFPSSLSLITSEFDKEEPQELNNCIDIDFTNIKSNKKSFFNVLDFSKCNKLLEISSRGLSNLEINELRLPTSLTRLNSYCFRGSFIKKIDLSNIISFHSEALTDGKYKDYKLNELYSDILMNEFAPRKNDMIFDNIILDVDGYIEANCFSFLNNLYLPISYKKFSSLFKLIVLRYVNAVGKAKVHELSKIEMDEMFQIMTSLLNKNSRVNTYYLHSQGEPLKTINYSDSELKFIERYTYLYALAVYLYLEYDMTHDEVLNQIGVHLHMLFNDYIITNIKCITQVYLYDADIIYSEDKEHKCDEIKAIDYKSLGLTQVEKSNLQFNVFLDNSLLSYKVVKGLR